MVLAILLAKGRLVIAVRGR